MNRYTLDDSMKRDWWIEAREKYTLSQLESIFGPKENLKDFKDIATTEKIDELEEAIWFLEKYGQALKHRIRTVIDQND